MIQGVRCHEHGCPDAWQDENRECSWCGSEFQPEGRWQAFDDDTCYASYNNLDVVNEFELAGDENYSRF